MDISRRQFIGTASAGMMAASAAGRVARGSARTSFLPGVSFTKTRILRVYISGARPSWPKPDLDLDAEMKRIQAGIDGLPGIEDVEFVGNVVVTEPTRLVRVLEQFNDVDGILAIQLCLGTSWLIGLLAESNIPTVVFGVPYSGHEWCIVPDFQRQGKKIEAVPSSDFKDAMLAIRPFRAIHRLKETKVLLVSGGWVPPDKFLKEVKEKLGTEIKTLDPDVLVKAFESIDDEVARPEFDSWISNAEVVKEPPRDEILKSSRFSLALQKVLGDEKAHAITINCLGLFGQGKLPAYPCLGFARLNDMGLAGVCEADLASTLTQIIYQHMENVPGFVTDPLFDLSNGAVIHAHCVSATKMGGPDGPQCPYAIRTHLEDGKGVSLQVKMRIGEEITLAKLVGPDPRGDAKPALAATPVDSLGASTMLISTGTIIDVPDTDRGCRTKISTKVRDVQKLLDGWRHGLHRVVFYGNHVADTRRLARFLGFNVVEEC